MPDYCIDWFVGVYQTTVNSLVSDHPWLTEKWSLMEKRNKISSNFGN